MTTTRTSDTTTFTPGALAGPADRVHFLDEQRRHRRASWRFSAMAVVAVLITGLPACIIATPLVFAVVLVVAHLVNLVAPLPPSTWKALEGIAFSIPALANTIDAGAASADWLIVALGIGGFVLPGALLLLGIWLWVRALFRRVGVGGVLHRLAAREPNPRDLEERQLGNLVEEMAIAAGVRPPRLMIIDSSTVNAAATGLRVDDATILVTRGLLDTLDRDQTQGVIAHLVGSVGNGDLGIAATIFSIYQTWGALALLLQLPFGPRSRKAIWRALRASLRRGDRVVDRWEEEFVSELFLRGSTEMDDDLGTALDGHHRRPSRLRAALQWPFVVTLGLGSVVVKFAIFVSSLLLIGPITSFMWRTRRYLADAMAVQLTRNPTALGQALDRLARASTAVPGGGAASFLFVIWSGHGAPKDAVVGEFQSMHPKVHRRYARLRALGGNLAAPGKRRLDPRTVVGGAILALLIGPLMAVALGGMVVLVVMLTMVTMMTMMVFLLATWGITKLLFVTLPAWIAAR